jgi:hypothetical protein
VTLHEVQNGVSEVSSDVTRPVALIALAVIVFETVIGGYAGSFAVPA